MTGKSKGTRCIFKKQPVPFFVLHEGMAQKFERIKELLKRATLNSWYQGRAKAANCPPFELNKLPPDFT
jgi:hypothetical protein